MSTERFTALPKFECPYCERPTQTYVGDARPNYQDGHYWRRHRCRECGETYTTAERVEALDRPTPGQRQTTTGMNSIDGAA